MDTLTVGVPPTSDPRAVSGSATRGGLPELGPDWFLMRNCALGGDGPRVGLALLHPGVGVALVDTVPKPTDTAGRLRRALDARRFPAIFGGYPPIVRVVLAADRSGELGRILASEFEAQPPLALAGGDAWTGTARAAIEAELPVAVPEQLRARRRRAFPWRAAVLAGVGSGFVAALALAAILPGHGPGNAIRRPAVVASVVAPGAALDFLPEAPPAVHELTAPDVTTAFTSASPATGSMEPGSAPTAMAAPEKEQAGPAPVAPDIASVHEPRLVPPAAALPDTLEAAPEPQTRAVGGATRAATAPEESGGAPPSVVVATAGEERPEPPQPASVAVEAPVAPAAGVDPARRNAPPAAMASPKLADAAAERREPRKSAASAPVDAPTRAVAPQVSTAGGRRAALSATTTPAAEAGSVGRCREILVRVTMGGALSEGDKETLRRGCHPRD